VTLDASVAVRRGSLDLQLDLTVAQGEVLAVLGPNGAGKSTLLRVLAGLLPPDDGTVVVDGTPWDDVPAGTHLPAHRRALGVVFQDALLFPHLTVGENIGFGLHTRGVRKAARQEAATAWLRRVGLDGLAARRPSHLSGGQAQRAALARALVGHPALLLLDEPLSALDARTRLVVRAELRRHLAEFDGSTVLVTHDPVDAMALADRVVVVEDGRAVQTGTPAEVSRRPRTDYVARLVGLSLLPGTGDGGVVRWTAGARWRSPSRRTARSSLPCAPSRWRCTWPGRTAARATSGRPGSSAPLRTARPCAASWPATCRWSPTSPPPRSPRWVSHRAPRCGRP
jgi:molybdate transport system ATP-binding protein